MSMDAAFQGSLFASDFLCDAITRSPDWQELDDASLEELKTALRTICARFPAAALPNESQTEDDLIWPVLARLGWTASLRQQNLSAYGRVDVPDGLLFGDEAAKGQANGFAEEWRRYELGLAVVESKRWLRPLDRRSGRAGEETAPSTQMLRYLRRIDDVTTGRLRWGILTDGARWRLYYQGARSVSEQFFEVDLAALLDLQLGDPIEIARGRAEASVERPESAHFAELLQEARRLIDEERFLNWQAAFPGVWTNWQSVELEGGFDAVIGNPPWDRMKLQQVEWFATRRREIALAPRAADRKHMIAALEQAGDHLAHDYALASERAAMATRTARRSGDYPLLSGGDVNLYSLFVERAMTLVKPDGMVGLLTPSGIASDKTAAPFFKGVATQGRLKALYDFENKKVFFPDVHASFKFCIFVASPSPIGEAANCAFYLHDVSERDDPERCFPLTAENFAGVNPNTGTAPIFRTRRDAALTTAIYERLPVLVDRSSGQEVKAWPVKYSTMFHMTNDSGLFRTRAELEEREGAYPIGGNRFASPSGDWVPLYEGKMVQAFDHRAASVVVNLENQHRPAQPQPATLDQQRDPEWLPDPQYWVLASECDWAAETRWVLGFKEITAPTNVRTFIAALLPTVGFGNKVPILKPETNQRAEWLLAANLNSTILDFATRQKVQGQTLNLFIVEQLPIVPPDRYESVRFGPKTAADIAREAVLELTYTAHDMAPFARDLGHVDAAGDVLPPFVWDEERRLFLRAKLDAVFFHLYGVTDRDDVRYVYSTFPIVEREETAAYGVYRSCDLCLAWMNALTAGNPDAEIAL